MKMKLLWVIAVFSIFGGVYGDLVLEKSGYQIETCISYAAPTNCERLVCDDAGNVYVAHVNGELWKMETNQTATHLMTYPNGPFCDIVWGGGTSYGNYLYGTVNPNNSSDSEVIRINPGTGSYSIFSILDYDYVPAIGIDRTSQYNGLMYVGQSQTDTYLSISTNGNTNVFSNWPGRADYCTPYGITFDTAGEYGNYMFVSRSTTNPQLKWASGLFAMDTDGNVSRFSDLEACGHIEFSPESSDFGYSLFSSGRELIDSDFLIWWIDETGTAERFISSQTFVPKFCFGPDGSMYLAQYDWYSHMTTISKVTVVPEPATLLIFVGGSITMLRRRKRF